MDVEQLTEKIEKLEKTIEEMEKPDKDGWDKAQIMAALLIPIAIAIASGFISYSIQEAQRQSTERIAEAQLSSSREIAASDQEIARINAKVSQAQLVSNFLDALTDDQNPQKKKVAIEAVLIALPEEGIKLVQTVSEVDPDQDVRAFARARLGDLSAEITFEFSSYEEAPGIPAMPIFAEGATLEIALTDAPEAGKSLTGWQNRLILSTDSTAAGDYETAYLTTNAQTVNRFSNPTVDGTTVQQTNTFLNFKGDLGRFGEPEAWETVTIEAIFRANSRDDWLGLAAGSRVITLEEFDAFYDITPETRDEWGDSDYAVAPVIPAQLTILLNGVTVASLNGYVASVGEHDEDVRGLHVIRFQQTPATQ